MPFGHLCAVSHASARLSWIVAPESVKQGMIYRNGIIVFGGGLRRFVPAFGKGECVAMKEAPLRYRLRSATDASFS